MKRTEIDKAVKIGIDAHGCGVFIEIAYTDNRLTISGYARKNSKCDYAYCGQIQDEINMKNIRALERGLDWLKIGSLLEIWDEWHLNDLHADCIHQRKLMPALIEKHGKNFFNADNLCNIWKEPEFGECSVCGYKYGTAWKFVEVPAGVLKFLREF